MSLWMHNTTLTMGCNRLAGDVVYMRMLGLDIILLNSERAAIALLEKCS